MKKIIKLMFLVILLLFFLIGYMLINNNKYIDTIRNEIIDNTELTNLEYVNKYNDYYIAISGDYLYLYDEDYEEVARVDRILIHENEKNYDIIYRDTKLMYFNSYATKMTLVYEYYDLYTYELIDKIYVGERS